MKPFTLRHLALMGVSLLSLSALPVRAATFTVSTLADSGEGSLRAAILAANSAPDADAIVFDRGLRGTIALSSGELPIGSDLTITGPGTNVLKVSGSNASRVFNVSRGSVAIRGLTLTEGRVVGTTGVRKNNQPGRGGNGEGGAIYNAGTLSLTDVVLSQNTAFGGRGSAAVSDGSWNPSAGYFGGQGGEGRGGAIYNAGTLSLLQTRLQVNKAVGGSGGSGAFINGWNRYIYVSGGPGGNAQGGAIYNAGALQMEDATFAGNSAVGGIGLRGWRYANGSGQYPDVRGASLLVEGVKVLARPGEPEPTPLNASDRVGNRRTFRVTVIDPKGVGDIKEVWLLLNKQLSWNAGATLIYVPSAATPRKGQLFLRSGDAFLPPVDIGVGSRAVLDNGAVSVMASEVVVSTLGNTFVIDILATIRDGLVGTNRVFARVVDQAGDTDPTAEPSDAGYRRFGNYTVTPQFQSATNRVPTLSALQPEATSTTLETTGLGPVQTFSFSATDADGTGDIESIWFTAGKSSNWTKSATLIYTPKTRRLVLRSDDGQSFLGGGVVGSAGILENSQVRVDLSQVRVTAGADGKTLSVVLPLQAKRGLVGQNRVYLRVQDLARAVAANGDAQGYVQSGAWIVGHGTASPVVGAAPSGGAS